MFDWDFRNIICSINIHSVKCKTNNLHLLSTCVCIPKSSSISTYMLTPPCHVSKHFIYNTLVSFSPKSYELSLITRMLEMKYFTKCYKGHVKSKSI